MQLSKNRYSHLFVPFVLKLFCIALILAACDTTSYNPSPPQMYISHDKIFVEYTKSASSLNNALAVFSTTTGKQLWQVPSVTYSSLLADNDTVYLSTDQGLSARDASSGKERWQTSQPMTARTVVNGIVYASSDSSLAAFQASDGKQLWTTQLPSGSLTTDVEADQQRVYVHRNSSFIVLDATHGQKLWSSPAFAEFARVNGIVYLGQEKDNVNSPISLTAMQESDGKPLWTFKDPGNATALHETIGITVTSDGVLGVKASDGIYGLRALDGTQLWYLPGLQDGVNARGTDDTITTLGVLYISTNQGLLALRAQDGHKLWQFASDSQVSFIDPNIYRGVIYVNMYSHEGSDKGFAAVNTANGSSLWEGTVGNDLVFPLVSNGIFYKLTPSDVITGYGGKQLYTQFDLMALRGEDRGQLWQTHFDMQVSKE